MKSLEDLFSDKKYDDGEASPFSNDDGMNKNGEFFNFEDFGIQESKKLSKIIFTNEEKLYSTEFKINETNLKCERESFYHDDADTFVDDKEINLWRNSFYFLRLEGKNIWNYSLKPEDIALNNSEVSNEELITFDS
jgi:hypothetical protein